MRLRSQGRSDQSNTPGIPVEPCQGKLSCEWLQRPDHPLLNSLILNIVFEHLRKKELVECRLVCKTWNVLTIPYIRKAFVVTIHENDRTRQHTMQKFVDDFRTNKLGIPFVRFRLGIIFSLVIVGEDFLKLCGDTVKEIRFSADGDAEDVSELLKSTPSLEIFQIPRRLRSSSGNVVKLFPDGLENSKSKLTSLKTLIVPFNHRKELYEFCPTFLDEIITTAQNISCLNTPSAFSGRSFEALTLIEKLGRESSIQELEISVKEFRNMDYKISDYVDLLLRITEKPNGMKLKRLWYNTNDFESDHGNLALQLIPHFKDTLECLQLFLHKNCCPDLTNFQKFLQELKVSQVFDVANDEFFPNSSPCVNMNALELHHTGMTIKGFNQMLIVFPNLTQLKIEIGVDGGEILRQVWSQMTQLKSLRLRGEVQGIASLDSVLIGIPIGALRKMNDVVQSLEKMTSEVERREIILKLRNQHSTLPSITNLTNLSSLSMELTGKKQGKFLTDLGGYLGFYSMKRLKQLSVQYSQLTKTCCETLRKDMGLEIWGFKNLMHKDIIPTSERRLF